LKQLVLVASLVGLIYAQSDSFNLDDYLNREVIAIRIDEPINIDGVLDEQLYATKSNGPLIQLEPNNGIHESQNTDYWVGYDDNAIFIGGRLFDSQPDSIVGRLGRRDTGFESNDQFGIVLDSYNDKRSGFFFVLNPSGTLFDGTLENDSEFSIDWDGIWYGKTKIVPDGWTAEMKIPFSQLRFKQENENIMGLRVLRLIQRYQEVDMNHYQARDESGQASHFLTLKGIKNIKPPKRLEITPYVTGNYGILNTEEDNPFFDGKDSDINIGTDLKIGLGNNLTVDATINPDFGQVEVDPSVLNLSAFETFYQEKRPFFIEGASIFRFGVGGPTNRINFGTMEPTFFYSRRIGNYPSYGDDVDGDWIKVPSATSIYGASKLSGKITDSWSIGAFSALTKREFADVQIDDENSKVEIEPLASYNLFRTLKEFNEGRQGLGIIATYVDRKFEDENLRGFVSDNSAVVGIDGWTFLNDEKDWAVGAWLGYSNVKGSKEHINDLQQSSARYYQRPDASHVEFDPDRTNLEGYAGKVSINRETGKWNFNSAVQFISPGFENNDMGLNFRADQINKHIAFGHKWLEPGKVFQFLGMNTAYMSNHNFAGDKTNEMIFLFGFARFSNFWSVGPTIGFGPRTTSDQKLRGGPKVIEPAGMWSRMFIRSDSRKSTIFELGVEYQREEQNSYSAHFSPSVELNLGTRLHLEIEPSFGKEFRPYQYVDSFDDETAVEMLGCRHIVAQMERKTVSAELRVDYTFTPKLSFQAYLQPYMTVGKYSRFKEFSEPESYDFVEYGKNNGMEIIADSGDGYELYPNGHDGESLYLENPDFNYKALVGSAVLRWEFRPGSTLYIVWTRNGSDDKNPGRFRFKRDFNHMMKADTDNVFAVKLTYWLGK